MKNSIKQSRREGFTLIEILVVIGIIAILAAVVLIAINPARQFAQARNSQRTSNINAILNAIGQNIADNKGLFKCAEESDTIPTTAEFIGKDEYNLRPCIVPTYMSEITADPKDGVVNCSNAACSGAGDDYDTKYTIVRDSVTQRIKVCAPKSQDETALGPSQSIICVER